MMDEENIELGMQEKECENYPDTIYINESDADEWEMSVEKSSAGSVTSLVLGIIGSVAWLVPVVAIPINVVGIVLGAINMKSSKHRGIAISGFVVNIVFLLVAIAKGIVDIVKMCKKK